MAFILNWNIYKMIFYITVVDKININSLNAVLVNLKAKGLPPILFIGSIFVCVCVFFELLKLWGSSWLEMFLSCENHPTNYIFYVERAQYRLV